MRSRSSFSVAVLLAATVSACSGGDGLASDDADIQLAVPAAKLAPQRVTAAADHSLQIIDSKPVHDKLLTVVLKLEGDPVAVHRSRAPNKHLELAEKLDVEAVLSAKQEALVPSIEALGGTVLARFQHAINGIKVQAPESRIAALGLLPGVVEVKRVAIHQRLNAVSVPFIGTAQVWNGKGGLHGEHVRVAIIDTGIDYTHANFGGPGTAAAYKAAFAAGAAAADPSLFGPGAPKVKGGIDLVGDLYDAGNAQSVAAPDVNPLDCGGHGSHVAGTVAGFGVLADGTTFRGPYDSTTASQKFAIGPGVAPAADLYAVRVFGCAGSTNVVTDALDWAVKNDMQVVNMSLGSPFGAAGDADSEASNNAANAGVIVVAAAGNEGPGFFITGSPGAGDKVISVAAMDSNDPPSYPGINVALTPAANIVVQNSNNAAFSATGLAVVVLPDGKGGISLGCNEAEYVDAQIAGKLVVTLRGTCPRIARAQFGFKHGAAAVALINNGPGYPFFEGDIATADGSGVVAIPFLGVLASDQPALAGASQASLQSGVQIANPAFDAFADFSSAGPRSGDGFLKPDISAPGVNIVSTAMGSGNQGVAFSGTSMATPHVAGVAALALQAHPAWDPDQVRVAILNTASADKIKGFSVRKGGSGLVQPYPATRTSVIATDEESGAANLSFGVAEFTSDFSKRKSILLTNLTGSAVKFDAAVVPGTGSPATVRIDPNSTTFWVEAHSSWYVNVTLSIPAKTAGDSSDFREVWGQIQFTPSGGSRNGGSVLSVPYYLVSRARALIRYTAPGSLGPDHPKATVKIRNDSSRVAGTADFYAWGLAGTNSKAGEVGLRAVGVQANPVGTDQLLFFAVNTFKPWSNNAENEFDVLIDVNGDGKPDFALIAADQGSLTTGSPSGSMVTAVLNLNDQTKSPGIQYPVTTPTNGTTLLLPVFASDIGVTAASPRFSYSVSSYGGAGGTDTAAGPARFNAFSSAISTASFATLAPGKHASVPLVIDPAEWKLTPALGAMIVGLENFNGGQARLLGVGRQSDDGVVP